MPRWILREIRRVDEWLPIKIQVRGGIVILVAQPDSGYRTPKIVEVLAIPTGNLGVGKCDISQREHAGCRVNVMQIGPRYIAQSALPHYRTTISPEITD